MISGGGDGLVFLLGPPRSGTTLLALLLGHHAEICSPPEPWLMFAVEAFGKVPAAHPAQSHLVGAAVQDFTHHLDLREAQRLFAVNLYNQALSRAQARFFIDKTPRYHLIAPFLAELFPQAKFIVLTRNPFARLASMKKTWRFSLPHAYWDTPGDALVADFSLAPRLLITFEQTYPDRCLHLTYEDLVKDTTTVYGQALAFVGASPAAVPQRFAPESAGYAGSKFVDPNIFAARGISRDSLQRWKTQLTPRELSLGFALLGTPLLQALGYHTLLPELAELGVPEVSSQVTASLVAAATGALKARWNATDRAATNNPADDIGPLYKAFTTAMRRVRRGTQSLGDWLSLRRHGTGDRSDQAGAAGPDTATTK